MATRKTQEATKSQPSSRRRNSKVYSFRLTDREAAALAAADAAYLNSPRRDWWERARKPSALGYCVRMGLKAVKMERRSRW